MEPHVAYRPSAVAAAEQSRPSVRQEKSFERTDIERPQRKPKARSRRSKIRGFRPCPQCGRSFAPTHGLCGYCVGHGIGRSNVKI